MDINQIAQNKPSLIAKDFEYCGVNYNTSMAILLNRGVFKWLSVRRKLIKLKDIWKDRVKILLNDIRIAKSSNDKYLLAFARGRLKGYEECRKEIRKLCHSSRLQAPDFDRKANQFLSTNQEAQ